MRTGEGICSHGHGPVAVLSAIRVVHSARSPGPAHHVVQKQVPVDHLSLRRRCRRRRRKPLNFLRLPRPRRRLSRAMALAPPPPSLSPTYARPFSRIPSSPRNPHTHPQASSLTQGPAQHSSCLPRVVRMLRRVVRAPLMSLSSFPLTFRMISRERDTKQWILR